MKRSTVLSLIATSLCCNRGDALVDIAVPAWLPASSLLSSESPTFSLASTFAESAIGSSSLILSESIPLSPSTPTDIMTSVMSHAVDFSGFLRPTKTMMRLTTIGSDSFTIAENLPVTTVTTASPLVEAEVLTDMAHVALDFSGLLSPSKSMMRMYSIFGRIFALGADYIPDHIIHPEELMIQFFLICVTMREMILEKLAVETPKE